MNKKAEKRISLFSSANWDSKDKIITIVSVYIIVNHTHKKILFHDTEYL